MHLCACLWVKEVAREEAVRLPGMRVSVWQ